MMMRTTTGVFVICSPRKTCLPYFYFPFIILLLNERLNVTGFPTIARSSMDLKTELNFHSGKLSRYNNGKRNVNYLINLTLTKLY